nr:hypothetical protein [uncultured Cohaesibacter sp.]
MTISLFRALGPLVVGVSLFCLSPGAVLAEQAWDADYYNPAGDPDVLLLPIPCGGKIALKKVVTITEDPRSPMGPLSDQRIQIGREAGRTGPEAISRKTITNTFPAPSSMTRPTSATI